MNLKDVIKVITPSPHFIQKRSKNNVYVLRQILKKVYKGGMPLCTHILYVDACAVNRCPPMKQMIQPIPTYKTNDIASVTTNI